MTRTPRAASAARTGPSTTDSDAAAEAAPQAGDNVHITVTVAELPQTTIRPPPPRSPTPPPRPTSPADDGSDSDSSSEIPFCDAPVVKKRKVEARTSSITMTDSERYKRDDAGCAERLKKREADEMVPCIDPEIGEDDQGVGARFQGYDGFTIGGPPVFR